MFRPIYWKCDFLSRKALARRLRLKCFMALALVCLSAVSTQAQSHWQVQASSTNSSLNGVAFGNGLFVAVGDSGVILTSPNGQVWTQRLSGTTDRLPAVAFGNGRFVATCANRDRPALTSPNGINWTPVTITTSNGAPTNTGAFEVIAFGGGRFMAAGSTNSTATELMKSEDGISFQTVIPARYPAPFSLDAGLKSLIYFRERFYGRDEISGYYASSDGVSWKRPGWSGGNVATTDGMNKVAIVGSSLPQFSIDAAHTFLRGELPVDRYLPKSSFYPVYRAGCYGAGKFVVVDNKGGVWTSIRGEFWVPRGYFATAGEEFRSVAFDGVDRFVAVGTAPASGSALIATADADPPLQPPPAYTVRSLKTLSNGMLGEAWGISNSGIIAGSVLTSNRVPTAAIFRDGVVSTYPHSSGYPSQAKAVNDNGIGAAEILLQQGSPWTWSMILPGMTQLFPSSGLYITARGINANGSVVGRYVSYPGAPSPREGIYRYDATTGQVTDLGNLGLSYLSATAINDSGDIAGTGGNRPYKLSAAGGLTRLPTLGGIYADAVAINNSGTVAGYSNMPYSPDTVFEVHAFLFKAGLISDIDTFNSSSSFAYAMNANDVVVGYFAPPVAEPFHGFAEHAFVHINGAMHDLNTLLDSTGDGWVLRRATAINDSGSIVGEGGLHGGLSEPFLAIPTSGTPAGVQTRFVNVSTRLRTGTGDDVLIGGFMVRGGPKRVVVRALGPALQYLGINLPDILNDPTLELFDGSGQRIAFNADFTDLPYAERNEIGGRGLAPPHGGVICRDSALIVNLGEGSYTAVVRGTNETTGNCLVEVYNVDTNYTPGLVNISTRGPVGVGDHVMIAGFMIRGDRERRVLVKGIGPSLAAIGVPNTLSDTTIEVFDQEGRIAENDDWRSQQAAEIISTGLAPGDDRESAVILSLWPGNYTAIVRGKGNASGNALVELYELP